MEDEEKCVLFHEMELDDRILKAIEKLGWASPTLIQEKAIPLLLEGKDVLVRARTGSGKTAAFSIPVIQKILNLKKTSTQQDTKALVLAPSKELCQQIYRAIKDISIKCSREVRCVDIAPQEDLNIQRPLLMEKPDIVVATPARCLQHMLAGNLNLKKSLEILVIDEADLVFSFGYETEIKQLLEKLPNIYQAILSSATLSEDVKSLKKIVLHNPVILKLEEPDLAPASQLTHYNLKAEEMDKATILYALLKLHLIRGKTIVFVNTVDKCYNLIFIELAELREEIIRLSYFEDNPTDLQVLRHDKALHTVKVQQHLSDVPDYIVPPTLKNLAGLNKKTKRKRDHSRSADLKAKLQAKKKNPLASMQFEGFKKKRKMLSY
ncbi:hypothetical protein YQE_02375, partial [Dendroctonus ponderosae]